MSDKIDQLQKLEKLHERAARLAEFELRNGRMSGEQLRAWQARRDRHSRERQLAYSRKVLEMAREARAGGHHAAAQMMLNNAKGRVGAAQKATLER